jgi:hypothetical protein
MRSDPQKALNFYIHFTSHKQQLVNSRVCEKVLICHGPFYLRHLSHRVIFFAIFSAVEFQGRKKRFSYFSENYETAHEL